MNPSDITYLKKKLLEIKNEKLNDNIMPDREMTLVMQTMTEGYISGIETFHTIAMNFLTVNKKITHDDLNMIKDRMLRYYKQKER